MPLAQTRWWRISKAATSGFCLTLTFFCGLGVMRVLLCSSLEMFPWGVEKCPALTQWYKSLLDRTELIPVALPLLLVGFSWLAIQKEESFTKTIERLVIYAASATLLAVALTLSPYEAFLFIDNPPVQHKGFIFAFLSMMLCCLPLVVAMTAHWRQRRQRARISSPSDLDTHSSQSASTLKKGLGALTGHFMQALISGASITLLISSAQVITGFLFYQFHHYIYHQSTGSDAVPWLTRWLMAMPERDNWTYAYGLLLAGLTWLSFQAQVPAIILTQRVMIAFVCAGVTACALPFVGVCQCLDGDPASPDLQQIWVLLSTLPLLTASIRHWRLTRTNQVIPLLA